MKRLTALILAALMLFALAACSQPTASPPASTAPATTAPATTPPASTAPDSTPTSSTGSGVDPTTLVPADAGSLPPVTFDWYIGQAPLDGDQHVNDAVNAYIKPLINATVNMHFLATADFAQKVPVMLAAGQDCGIVNFGNQAGLDYMTQVNQGSFLPLEDLLNNDAPQTKALFPQSIWDCMSTNGHVYGIPSLKDNCYIMSMVYNADMADKLGLDMSTVQFKSFADIEPFFDQVMAKRTEVYGKLPEPLCGGIGMEIPIWFALESFIGGNGLAVCNVPGIDNMAGYDNNTVFNMYATPECKAAYESMQRMVSAGILAADPVNIPNDYYHDGNMFAFLGWGYAYMPPNLYGPTFTTKQVMAQQIWTDTGNYFTCGNAISANSANADREMMFLNLVNNDPTLATMLRFGVEGTDYTLDTDGSIVPNTDANYNYWYGAPFGNLLVVNAPPSLAGPDSAMQKGIEQANASALQSAHMGFVLDPTPIANEIAACNNVIQQYQPALVNGQLGSTAEVDASIDAFNAALKANGEDKIITEVQRQIDAWNAARGN